MIAGQGHRETVIIVGALQGPEIKGQIYTIGNSINGRFGQEKEADRPMLMKTAFWMSLRCSELNLSA